jgi:putative thioredoxin
MDATEASASARRSESKAMTAATFDKAVIAASSVRPLVVDFWAGWCAPCRTLGPILEQAVALHGGVTLAKLDVDANPEVTARFGIQGIPAVKRFRDGQLVAEFVGLQPRAQVERFLAQLAPAAPPPPPPSDETSLRAAVLDQPDDVTLRRALGALLLQAGRIDEADTVLSAARDDQVCDGLRARIEIRRDGDPALAALVGDADDPTAVRRVIAAIRDRAPAQRAQLRRVVLGALLDHQGDPALEALRGELASALF